MSKLLLACAISGLLGVAGATTLRDNESSEAERVLPINYHVSGDFNGDGHRDFIVGMVYPDMGVYEVYCHWNQGGQRGFKVEKQKGFVQYGDGQDPFWE